MSGYTHSYTLSKPLVREARARNKCRVCLKAINRGEKYLFCMFIDKCLHPVTLKGHRGYYPFHEEKKFCLDCAVELFRLKDRNIYISDAQRKTILETIESMLPQPSRFDIIKEITPLQEYLKNYGIGVLTLEGK